MSRTVLSLRGAAHLEDGERTRPDRARQLVWVVLGLYLLPVLLVIALVAGVGIVTSAVARWLSGGPRRNRATAPPAVSSDATHDHGATPPPPHLAVVASEAWTSRR